MAVTCVPAYRARRTRRHEIVTIIDVAGISLGFGIAALPYVAVTYLVVEVRKLRARVARLEELAGSGVESQR